MSDGLPKGWTKVPFSALLTDLRNGISTRPNLEPPGTPILRISAVRPGNVLLDDHRFLRNGEDLATTFALRDRDLLFTRYNGSLKLVGVCGMVRGKEPAVVLYPDKLMRARVDERITSPAYIELFFQSPEARDAIMAIAKSSAGQQGISGANLKEQVVALAPLAEQDRIVEKVQALIALVTAARDRLAKVPAILKRFRQSVLAAACSGKLIEAAAEEWPETSVGDLLIDARYGTSDRCGERSRGSVPVLRVPNIASGRLALTSLKFAVPQRSWNALMLRDGDILICRTNGSLDLVGKAAVVANLPEPAAFASYLIRLRTNAQVLLPRFLHLLLLSPSGRDQITAEARTTAGQFNLNLEILRSLRFVLPPVDAQAEIVRRAAVLFSLADTIERSVAAAAARAAALTQSILAKAFRGELVPTEAELARTE